MNTNYSLEALAEAVEGFQIDLFQRFALMKGFDLMKGDKLYIPQGSGIHIPRKLKDAVMEHPLCPKNTCFFVKASLSV